MKHQLQKVVCIVQARMQSTRLPGKVLKPVLDTPLLSYLLDRLKTVRNIDQIVVATTLNSADNPIVEFCRQYGVDCFRGDEQDVLNRYLNAARVYAADAVVRITADCPLIDPRTVENVIQVYLSNDYDYVGNTLVFTYPRGMDTEVFSMKALEQAESKAVKTTEREHVTLYLYTHPEQFRLKNVPYPVNCSEYRLTVDTFEDFELVKRVLEHFYPAAAHCSLEDILAFLRANPDLSQINRHIAQKKVEER